jgi:phenylacetate-CoA ligase
MVDPFLGRVLNAGGDLALSSWGTYRMLFAPPLTGPTRDWLARRRAAAAFFQARRRVPAYGDFLREHGALDVADWADVPAMDKAGYIARWPIEALCLDGRLPTRGAVIDESSGSSGAASNWVRGEAERRAARKLMQLSSRSSFGEESFILLNAFALGPWATGMNVSMALVDRCVLKSIGPDVDKVVATLKLLGPKYPYVIAGYPPFLKTLIDTADIDWREYNVRAVVGGEGMSEPLRAALNRCFRSTISSFGASDLEINLAVETPFSIALRQAIDAKPALGHDLFGREALPMIFQYDPLNCLVESDDERNLLFTINRLANVSPRVRYNIHDRGIVRSLEQVDGVLRDHGVRLAYDGARIPLPLLFHWGRQDSSVGFYGCKITPDDIQQVVLRVPALAALTAHFALHPYEDAEANKRLELWIELKADAAVCDDLCALDEAVWRELSGVNQDFRESIKMVPRNRRPTLELFPSGQSPLTGQDVRLKRRYIL